MGITMVNDSPTIRSSRHNSIFNIEAQIMFFLFTFPLNRKPTDEEMDRFKEWILLFWEHRNNLSSFELARA